MSEKKENLTEKEKAEGLGIDIIRLCAWCYHEGYNEAEKSILKKLTSEPNFETFQKKLVKRATNVFEKGTL